MIYRPINTPISLPAHSDIFTTYARTTFTPTLENRAWNLGRINQCMLPLDGVSKKEDSTGVKVFIMEGSIRGDHKEFASALRGKTNNEHG